MKKVKKSYWRTAGWGAAFGIIGIIPSAINVSKTNKKVQADYEYRVIKGGNLIPGSVTEGMAFFSVPPDISSLGGWKVSLVLVDPSTDERIAVEYGLQGTVVSRQRKNRRNGDQNDSEITIGPLIHLIPRTSSIRQYCHWTAGNSWAPSRAGS